MSEGKPKSGAEMLMQAAEHHVRDRALATAIGAEMAQRFFNPENIADMGDVRSQIVRAAEQAAYDAIQKERQRHAGDMRLLEAWAASKDMLQASAVRVVPILDEPPT